MEKGRAFLAALFVLSLAIGGVQVLMSFAARDFITSLTQRDHAGWMRAMWKYLGTFALSIPIAVLYRYCGDRLSLAWRKWMTQHLVKRYFFNHAYYRMRGSEVDNPDQRIADDVGHFTTNLLGYSLVIVNSVVTLFSFLGVLYTISGKLVGALFIYAAAGTCLSMLIGRRLVGLQFDQYKKEANFRYGLIRVRDNAESIAFFNGEKREHRDLIERFSAVLMNSLSIIGWNRNLGFFTNGYTYVALILPTLVVGPMYMAGKVEFGVVTQAGSAFAQVLAAVSVITAQFEGLSIFAAGIVRLGGLWDNLDHFDIEEKREAAEEHVGVEEREGQLSLDKLTVQTPGTGKTLIKDLSLDLQPGEGLCIAGDSGVGKSSLLRTIAGLWHPASGTIKRPTLNRMMFLPQKPYMVEGNLRAQLMYPLGEQDADDAAIEAALNNVNLKEIFDRVDGDLTKVMDWTNILSLGEQQRISFARLFLKKPDIAFLDEATSALGEADERMLYELLRASGISFVSVGHRSSLKQFHDRMLLIQHNGTFEFTDLAPGQTFLRRFPAWLFPARPRPSDSSSARSEP